MLRSRVIILTILLISLVLGCENRREVVSERYPDGSKKVVKIFSGEGTNEKLEKSIYYSDSGTKIYSGVKSFWDLHGYDKFTSLIAVETHEWVSEARINTESGTFIERVSMYFSLHPDTSMTRIIETKRCGSDQFIEQLRIKSDWSISKGKKGEFNEDIKEIRLNNEKRAQIVSSLMNGTDAALPIYISNAYDESNIKGGEIDILNPVYIKGPKYYSKFVVKSGGVGLNVFSYKGMFESDEGVISNPHDWFVEAGSYKGIECS